MARFEVEHNEHLAWIRDTKEGKVYCKGAVRYCKSGMAALRMMAERWERRRRSEIARFGVEDSV